MTPRTGQKRKIMFSLAGQQASRRVVIPVKGYSSAHANSVSCEAPNIFPGVGLCGDSQQMS